MFVSAIYMRSEARQRLIVVISRSRWPEPEFFPLGKTYRRGKSGESRPAVRKEAKARFLCCNDAWTAGNIEGRRAYGNTSRAVRFIAEPDALRTRDSGPRDFTPTERVLRVRAEGPRLQQVAGGTAAARPPRSSLIKHGSAVAALGEPPLVTPSKSRDYTRLQANR